MLNLVLGRYQTDQTETQNFIVLGRDKIFSKPLNLITITITGSPRITFLRQRQAHPTLSSHVSMLINQICLYSMNSISTIIQS